MPPRTFAILAAATVWFAVLTQLVLMIQHRQVGVGETLARFFTFFTILTNTLVGLYWTVRASGKATFLTRPGARTALTAFILVVGIVYQVVLRWLWEPAGLQWMVDELLHTVIPAGMLIYFLRHPEPAYRHLPVLAAWLLYPFAYLLLVIGHGAATGFYPYPFVNVTELGYPAVLRNAVLIAAFSLVLLTSLALYARWRRASYHVV